MQMQSTRWMLISLMLTYAPFGNAYADAGVVDGACLEAKGRAAGDGSEGAILCSTLAESREDAKDLADCIECEDELNVLKSAPVAVAPKAVAPGLTRTEAAVAGLGIVGASLGGVAIAALGAPLVAAGALGAVVGGVFYAGLAWML